MEGGAVGHNFEMGLPKDYPCQAWFNLVQQFQRRRFFSVNFFFQPIYTHYTNYFRPQIYQSNRNKFGLMAINNIT
jgi:hypothetical protein